MNELFSVPKTPSNARRIIAVSEIYGFGIPEDLRELSNTGKVSTNSTFRDAIQLVVDWEYRCTVRATPSNYDAFLQDLVEFLILSGEKVLLTYSSTGNRTLLGILERMKNHRTVPEDMFRWIRTDKIDDELINENVDRILIDISMENYTFFSGIRTPVEQHFIRAITVVTEDWTTPCPSDRMVKTKTHHSSSLGETLFTGMTDWLKFSKRSGFVSGATVRDYYKAIGIAIVS